jgi:hypothetical protein
VCIKREIGKRRNKKSKNKRQRQKVQKEDKEDLYAEAQEIKRKKERVRERERERERERREYIHREEKLSASGRRPSLVRPLLFGCRFVVAPLISLSLRWS